MKLCMHPVALLFNQFGDDVNPTRTTSPLSAWSCPSIMVQSSDRNHRTLTFAGNIEPRREIRSNSPTGKSAAVKRKRWHDDAGDLQRSDAVDRLDVGRFLEPRTALRTSSGGGIRP
jgi:hypothetical protein